MRRYGMVGGKEQRAMSVESTCANGREKWNMRDEKGEGSGDNVS